MRIMKINAIWLELIVKDITGLVIRENVLAIVEWFLGKAENNDGCAGGVVYGMGFLQKLTC